MKIESIIKRKNGTKVEMHAPERTYHFRPEEDSETAPHVADVDVQDHALTFLRITEGYRLAEGENMPGGMKKDENNDNDDVLNGSTIHNASYEVQGGVTVSLHELVEMAFDDSGLTHDEWNKLSDEDRYSYIDATLGELQGDDGGNGGNADLKNLPTLPVVDTASPPPFNNAPPAPTAPAAGPDASLNSAGNAGDNNGAGSGTGGGNTVGRYDLDNTDRKTLAEDYEKKFGRKPSTRMSKEDLANALSEED